MPTLTRVHHTAFGDGLRRDDQSQLTIDAKGESDCRGFPEHPILQQINPGPDAIYFLSDGALWVSMHLPPPLGLGNLRLMEVEELDRPIVGEIIARHRNRQRRQG